MRVAVVGAFVVAACGAALGVVYTDKLPSLPAGLGLPAIPGLTKAPAPPAAVAAPAPAPRVAPANPVTTMAAAPSSPAPAVPPPAPAAAATTAAATTAAGPATPMPAPLPAPAPTAKPAAANCANPNALGVTRTVEIDTTGGPGFGFEHFKTHDFLRDKEVVLTFDDGPWQTTTPLVLKALADQCVKATFFTIGKHATYYPEVLRQVAEGGHTVGTHTWSHTDLSKKKPEEAIEEIEKGISAVRLAVGPATAPFFRFPALRHPPETVTYLGERNVAIFSTDMDSFDFKTKKPEQVIKSVMDKLKKHGKGIVLMHDFQNATAHAVPQLLAQLKAEGYKIVHMKAKDQLQSIAKYDEMLVKDQKLPTVSTRPTSSVVRTVE